MAEFLVDPAELITLADGQDSIGTVLAQAASILDQGGEAGAPAAGDPELSTAIRDFCRQWADELRRESEGATVNATHLRVAAENYQGAEDRASQI